MVFINLAAPTQSPRGTAGHNALAISVQGKLLRSQKFREERQGQTHCCDETGQNRGRGKTMIIGGRLRFEAGGENKKGGLDFKCLGIGADEAHELICQKGPDKQASLDTRK